MFCKKIVLAFFISKIIISACVDENNHFNQLPLNKNDSIKTEFENFQINKEAFNRDCNYIKFQTRELWGARPYLARHYITTPVNKVFFEVSGSHRCYNFPQCAFYVRQLQDFYMDTLKLSDINFNFLIGDDSRVYIGRGYDTQRELDPEFNSNSLITAFLGNNKNVKFISPKTLYTAYKVIKCGQIQKFIADNYTIYEPHSVNCHNGFAKKVYRFISQNRINNAKFVCLPRM